MNNVENHHLQPAKARRYFAALLLMLPALVFLTSLALMVKLLPSTPRPTQTESEFTPQQVVVRPSRWATDSAVLTLEKEILEQKARSAEGQLEEPELLPPIMDFAVSFEGE